MSDGGNSSGPSFGQIIAIVILVLVLVRYPQIPQHFIGWVSDAFHSAQVQMNDGDLTKQDKDAYESPICPEGAQEGKPARQKGESTKC